MKANNEREDVNDQNDC